MPTRKETGRMLLLTAIKSGADFTECDLQFTKDEVGVCTHDYWLSATTDISDRPEFGSRKRNLLNFEGEGKKEDWLIWDFTMAEVSRLRLKQDNVHRSKQHDGMFGVSTLQDFINIGKNSDVGLNIETKIPGHYNNLFKKSNQMESVEGYLVDMLTKNQLQKKVVLNSFEPGSLVRMDSLTRLPLYLLTWTEEQLESIICLKEILSGVGIWKNQVLPYYENRTIGANTGLVAKLHKMNLKVQVYTFRNDDTLPFQQMQDPYYELDTFYNLGVDSFFTDFPPTVIRFLDHKQSELQDSS